MGDFCYGRILEININGSGDSDSYIDIMFIYIFIVRILGKISFILVFRFLLGRVKGGGYRIL